MQCAKGARQRQRECHGKAWRTGFGPTGGGTQNAAVHRESDRDRAHARKNEVQNYGHYALVRTRRAAGRRGGRSRHSLHLHRHRVRHHAVLHEALLLLLHGHELLVLLHHLRSHAMRGTHGRHRRALHSRPFLRRHHAESRGSRDGGQRCQRTGTAMCATRATWHTTRAGGGGSALRLRTGTRRNANSSVQSRLKAKDAECAGCDRERMDAASRNTIHDG